ncbi:MAG: hypothetical protein IJ649_01525 [Oscillospiraceae bacterium]|nr:hypothetical protein [Oscillospiraceae bacterium]
MLRKSFLVLAAAATLAGCSTPMHDFAGNLPQPRPVTEKLSEASTILYTRMPQYLHEKNPKLVVDTACWEDEPCNLGGFDPEKILNLISSGRRYDKLEQARKEILCKYGTLPHFAESGPAASSGGVPIGKSAVNSATDAMMFSGSVGSIGFTQRGASGFSNLGIGIGIAEFVLGTDWGMDMSLREKKLYEQRNISFSLPRSEWKEFKEAKAKSEWEARMFAGRHLLKRMERILADKGFEPRGGYWYGKGIMTDDWYVFQAVSNRSIGCPEPEFPSDRTKGPNSGDICRIECYIGAVNMYFAESDEEIRIGITGNELPDYSTNGFGTPYRFIADTTAVPHKPAVNAFLFDELIKRYPDVVLYEPARKRPDGTWEPQYVLDKNGRHYFVVTVPRTPNALTTALYDDSLAAK